MEVRGASVVVGVREAREQGGGTREQEEQGKEEDQGKPGKLGVLIGRKMQKRETVKKVSR